MLFNSFAFLLVFLPLALVAHGLAERYGQQVRVAVLVALSFGFYAVWDWRFAPLLAASIVVNWLIARLFCGALRRGEDRGWLITGAIGANLLLLGLFKYTGFAADALNAAGASFVRPDIVLPLGISFFTFHHIMYLVDLRAGKAPSFSLSRYALYLAFFPQVLAGPLVRWSELMHQFDARLPTETVAKYAAQGVLLLTIGLAKKVLLGDPLADYVNPVFAAAEAGQVVTVREAWQAVLAFGFQIYFDFSGYTDMAIGIALLFGVVLPQNFEAPYRAASLQDFWRRWHMTLSRFLRDYLYVPLGGNRRGLSLQLLALLTTMTLGGLWHGAGVTFILWGVVHGIGLCIALLWRRMGLPCPAPVGWALTFLFVMLAWVLFRAPSLDGALVMYQALLGYAPMGDGFKWRAIVAAAAVALVGPTSWQVAGRYPFSARTAIPVALLFVLVLLKIGDDANFEFIYFQF